VQFYQTNSIKQILGLGISNGIADECAISSWNSFRSRN
jgi:hypothetical protein